MLVNEISQSCLLSVTAILTLYNNVAQSYVIQTLSDSVDAYNYTYYKLMKAGRLQLVLNTSEGDGDLYVSEKTVYPTYDDYDLQSVTCGLDYIEIPVSFGRPVYVAVFGYVAFGVSRYQLSILKLDDYVEHNYAEHSYESSDYTAPPNPSRPGRHPPVKDNEESMLWNVVVGILKILFDVML